MLGKVEQKHFLPDFVISRGNILKRQLFYFLSLALFYSTQINKFLSTILNIQGEMLLDLGSCSTLNYLLPRKIVSLESFNSNTRTGRVT